MQWLLFLFVTLVWVVAAAHSYSRSDVAIALIACGHVAREGLVTLCVKSIRDDGKWTGALYLFTDAIECAPQGVSIVPIAFDKSCEDDDLLYKSLKMMVLRETTERYLLYVDVDVIVAKPLESFVAMSIERIQRSSLVVYDEVSVTPDPVHAKRLNREPYHGGVFFAERSRSEDCLDAWRSKIIEKMVANETTQRAATSSLRDQPLLRECVDEGRCSVSFFESDTLLKPNATTIGRGYYATLNHLGRTSRLKRVRNRHNMTATHLMRIGIDLLHLSHSRSRTSWWLDPPANCDAVNLTTIQQQQQLHRRRRKRSVHCVSTRVQEIVVFSPSNALEMWFARRSGVASCGSVLAERLHRRPWSLERTKVGRIAAAGRLLPWLPDLERLG